MQVISKRRDSSSNYDSNNDEYDTDENRYENDEDEDETSASDTDDEYNDDGSEKKSISDSEYSGDDWEAIGRSNNCYADSDEEKYRKLTYKFPLDAIEYLPFIAVNNQKMLKWKFLRREESDWTTDSCSFKIYSCVSKNLDSAFYLLDELIDQIDVKKFQPLSQIWSYLIKISCAQVFNKRLKIFSLLIKILQKIYSSDLDKSCINIYALKPLKSLQYNLETFNREDRNLSRALFELFFFVEKLTIKWSIQLEYKAMMKDRSELIEKLCETSYFVNLIMASLNMSNNLSALNKLAKTTQMNESNLESDAAKDNFNGENEDDDDEDDENEDDDDEGTYNDDDDDEDEDYEEDEDYNDSKFETDENSLNF